MLHRAIDEEWLRARLHALGGPEPNIESLQPLISRWQAKWSQADDDMAVLYLTQMSERRRKGETRTLMSPAKVNQGKWAYEDYSSVLEEIVAGIEPAGVIDSVLNLFETNNPKKTRTGTLRMRQHATGGEKDSLMAGLLITALGNNRLDQFQVLAHHAGETVATEAIPRAISANNINALRILIEERADVNQCSDSFLECVQAERLDFVRLLLQSHVSREITTEALSAAVLTGNIEIIQLLLAHGASANFKNGLAIRRAIADNRRDIIILLLLCDLPPSSGTLASLVLHIWSEHGVFSGRQGDLIEILLNGGARGDDVDSILLGAVKQRWGDLVRLLMSKGTSVACFNGQAYREALHIVDYEMLGILNKGSLGKALASDIFASIDNTKYGRDIPPEDWHKLAMSLLRHGAAGDAVHEALINRIRMKDLKASQMLLKYNASVDYKGGCALALAVCSEDLRYICPILERKPSVDSINAAFSCVTDLSESVRLEITCRLLDAGATGASVDAVLKIAVNLQTQERDPIFIKALVDGKADVTQNDGSLFLKVVKDGDENTLRILLRGRVQIDILYKCVPVAMKLKERWRFTILEILLNSGAIGGPIIGQALVDSIDERDESPIQVTELLLKTGAANTAFNEGEAFKKAIACHNVAFLKLLLFFNHLNEVEFYSCLSITIGLPRDELRLDKMELLLTIGVNMADEYWIASLKHEMICMRKDEREALGAVNLLLGAGADVNYNNGTIVCLAIEMGYFECFKLYTQSQLRFSSHEAVFNKAFSHAVNTADLRYIQRTLELRDQGLPLDNALLLATECGDRARDLCELLLQNRASPSHENGAPICSAIKSGSYSIGIVELLLKFNPSVESIAAALECAFIALHGQERLAAINLLLTSAKPKETLNHLLLKTSEEPVCDHRLLGCILRADPSVPYQSGACIVNIVLKNDKKALQILQMYFKNRHSLVSQVFETAWGLGARAEYQEDTLGCLLANGAAGRCLDIALVDTIDIFTSSPKNINFIKKLLGAGADVNFSDGASLHKIAASGNLEILKDILAHNPFPNHITLAFPQVFTSGVDSETLYALVVAFCSHDSPPNLTNTLNPILFLLLQNSPTEKCLVEYLIQQGCPVDPPVETSRGKYSSLISWALIETEYCITFEVIDTLLDAGANPNQRTAVGHTPLEIAISKGRPQVVETLLRHGADVKAMSGQSESRSMLFLAVTSRNPDIVRMVMSTGFMVHDGALHEAAREIDTEIIEILVTEGKQKDYAYSGCNGRTALAELCLRGDGNRPLHELKRAMTLLSDYRNFRSTSNGKSALHLALDNSRNALFMTMALLDTVMAAHVNDEFNLFEEGGLVYSPITYVAKNRNMASSVHNGPLVELLSQFGCKARFWAKGNGPQPDDVIDPPPELAKMINDKQAHKQIMKRFRIQSEEAQSSVAARHMQILKNEKEAADQRARLEKEAESRHISALKSRHSAEVAQLKQLTRAASSGYRSSVDLQPATSLSQYAQLDYERKQAELAHLTAQQAIITAGYKERVEIEKKTREEHAFEMRRLREQAYEIGLCDFD